MFNVSGRGVSVAEGWRAGPASGPLDDPEAVGPVLLDLVSRALPNADQGGRVRRPDDQ
jgi:hypothetical protein